MLEVELTSQRGHVATKMDKTFLRPKTLRRQYLENQAI